MIHMYKQLRSVLFHLFPLLLLLEIIEKEEKKKEVSLNNMNQNK
jgi:hypothetical protein